MNLKRKKKPQDWEFWYPPRSEVEILKKSQKIDDEMEYEIVSIASYCEGSEMDLNKRAMKIKNILIAKYRGRWEIIITNENSKIGGALYTSKDLEYIFFSHKEFNYCIWKIF